MFHYILLLNFSMRSLCFMAFCNGASSYMFGVPTFYDVYRFS
ncbi:unnamed protein product [Brassica napus]|uniref:(rape) hypothetical protein n=1 Tax=Brassica napus TaxID=3708 RepID=A0A816NJ46_BRANA|nr:unnamed protein product [Brassica napus]